MSLDKSHDYIYRLGSDTQHRLHWTGAAWQYEFLASAVLFDEQLFHSDRELHEGLALVGLTIDKFSIDPAKNGESYSADIKKRQQELTAQGMDPCAKHGMTAKNPDGTCEACNLTDYPDDFKGQEG
jgi:hypothetical protein